METTHSKTDSSQEQSIDGIDWDEIKSHLETAIKTTLPAGAVTRRMIEEETGCTESSAKRAMNRLCRNGWEKSYYNCGTSRAAYVIKKGVE